MDFLLLIITIVHNNIYLKQFLRNWLQDAVNICVQISIKGLKRSNSVRYFGPIIWNLIPEKIKNIFLKHFQRRN